MTPTNGILVLGPVFDDCFALSSCRAIHIFFTFLEKTRFRVMFHNFAPSGFPCSLIGSLWGSLSAARFRVMYHIIGLSGHSDVASYCIVNTRHRGWICIQFQLLETFSGLWVAQFHSFSGVLKITKLRFRWLFHVFGPSGSHCVFLLFVAKMLKSLNVPKLLILHQQSCHFQ